MSDIRDALNAGVDKVSVNSTAVKDPSIISEYAESFGSQCMVVVVDGKRADDCWKIFTRGGTRPMGIGAVEWAKRPEDLGVGEILLTSMDTDSVKTGYNIPLMAVIADEVDILVIASGGCGCEEHILDVFSRTRASAALVISIFHYNECSVGK